MYPSQGGSLSSYVYLQDNTAEFTKYVRDEEERGEKSEEEMTDLRSRAFRARTIATVARPRTVTLEMEEEFNEKVLRLHKALYWVVSCQVEGDSPYAMNYSVPRHYNCVHAEKAVCVRSHWEAAKQKLSEALKSQGKKMVPETYECKWQW